MNPVRQLRAQLSTTQTITGLVQAIEGQWLVVATGNTVERWLSPGGMQIGDQVKIYNGKLTKVATTSPLSIYEV